MSESGETMQKSRGTNLIYGERHTRTPKRVLMSGVGRYEKTKFWTTVPSTKNHRMDVLVDNPKVTL